ncbi:cytochrome P450 [Spongisporangium articulatum]|uniref:Cytochrome P450 n=1 Tax=Spongisporangium articulatum TaxID=3362603 RepID=A0ABW8AMD7_9ACTN
MFDPTDPAFLDDPYPTFARLRADGPVHWHEGLGLYVAVAHAAADAVLRDRGLGRIWQDKEPAELFPAFNLLHRTSILESEPPTHTRLRRLVAGAFGRGHVERLRPWIDTVAGRLVEDFAGRLDDSGPAASADLIEHVAEPLPVEVIAELLGVPAADRHLLRPWSNTIVKMYEYGLDDAGRARAERASAEFVAYLRDLVAERRARPWEGDLGADLVTDLVAASDGEDRLSEDEIVGTCVLLLMAGHEASVNVVGNGVFALLQHPDQWRALTAGAPVAPAVEELLRYDSALQLFERTATRDVELAGTTVRAGQKVAALLGAANRDPAVFERPDDLDVTRERNPHIAFGSGIHFCLGAPLARVEIQSVLGHLAARLPGLHLDRVPPRRPEFVIRGLRELPVRHAG